jgi:hypothetical protein
LFGLQERSQGQLLAVGSVIIYQTRPLKFKADSRRIEKLTAENFKSHG